MIITENILLLILIVHFIADFMLQTHEQAVNKYKINEYLGYHISIYSLCWFFMTWYIFNNIKYAFIFAVITFLCHFITDAITSNWSKYYFDKKDYHNGFVIIGIDQILHYIQLYLTFKLILPLC